MTILGSSLIVLAAAFQTPAYPATLWDTKAFVWMDKLVERCEQADYVGRGLCGDYVAGVVDGLSEAQIFDKSLPQFCLPPGMSKLDLLDMTLRVWLANSRGNERPVSAARFIHIGLVTNYRCPAKPSGGR